MKTEPVFSKKQKNITYGLMTFLVIAWGFDYVVCKFALQAFPPMTLLFVKYAIGLVVMLMVKMKVDRKTIVRLKDVPIFVFCAIFGQILYFFCEYTAMSYMPVSLVSIMLAFVPVVSIITERILYKKRTNKLTIIGVLVCIFGVALIIGVDFDILFQGRIIGYILTFIAVLSWNGYNFLTATLSDRYSSITLTCTQLICTILLTFPYAVNNMPSIDVFTPGLIGGIIYLGIVNAGIGFLISVRGIQVLGPTAVALFSNFLPITTAFFGWLCLKETISGLQIIGGLVVICAGFIVIREKGKMEDQSND
ncbi:MAG: DMT family transporter [Anaerovoracaceae bacterium]